VSDFYSAGNVEQDRKGSNQAEVRTGEAAVEAAAEIISQGITLFTIPYFLNISYSVYLCSSA
jgi:hypothetical protein